MRCPACDAPNPAEIPRCVNCGEDLSALRGQNGDANGDEPVEENGTMLPYRNPGARWAYLCGLGGLVPFVGLVLGPAALALGLFGLNRFKANPRVRGKSHALAGVVLGGLELVLNAAALACWLAWLRVL